MYYCSVSDLNALQSEIGYQFRDVALLRLALTHPSVAHEQGRSSRGVYNKAQYAEQRRHMLQEWANMIDAWVRGKGYAPSLLPTVVSAIAPESIASLFGEAA